MQRDSDGREGGRPERAGARPDWVCPSTRAFIEEARRTPGFSRSDLLHGYVYARWTYLYISIGTGEHWLARPLGSLPGCGAACRAGAPPSATMAPPPTDTTGR